MTTDGRDAAVTLIVLYTEHLDDCRAFYANLGLPLVREQHGDGPVHHAAELGSGTVLEIYPGTTDRLTGALRLGLQAPAGAWAPGRYRLTDPDGRTVVLDVVGE